MIVVTGAAGFIGSNIVAALNERGEFDIVLCDWFGQDERWMNLRKAMFSAHVLPENLTQFIEKKQPRAIIHMGANSATTATNGDEIAKFNSNFTLNLIEQCAHHSIPLIYASSAATYGEGEFGYVDDFNLESLRRLRPLNLYGWSKSIVDANLAWRVEQGRTLPPRCIGLKFFNVYGPNEFHKGAMMSVVGKAFPTASSGGVVELFKSHCSEYQDGGQLRDFVYVEDAVEVVLWFLENGPAYGVFNCGTGKAQSFLELTEALFSALGRDPLIRYVDMPEDICGRYQYFTEASLINLRSAGYTRAFRSVEEGVERYVEFLERKDPYR